MTKNVIDAICDMAVEDAIKAHVRLQGEHIASIEYALASALRDIRSLKAAARDLADLFSSLEERVEKLERSPSPVSRSREAAEMRKAASMLYARSKQLEGE